MRIKKSASQINVKTALSFAERMKEEMIPASALVVDIAKVINAPTASRLLQLLARIELELEEIIFEAKQLTKK